ncbi:MAG TPA: alpha/beta fold hydrolase, partial [Steroidobacteraceae bacterium]|nr:alpha/beta fold hydrolase [Steroidobacteraceae bacterium]
KEAGATEAGAAVAGDLDAAPAEQRIAIVAGDSLRWASPAELFVYEYDWRPGGEGFVGTAAPGDGDNNWWTAKLYAFAPDAPARLLYAPSSIRQQLATPVVSPDGRTVAFIAGIMSDFGSTGGDVYALTLAGGAARNLTPDMKASATALAWGCDGKLLARLLAGDQTQLVTLGNGAEAVPAQLKWRGPETLGGHAPAGSLACRAGIGAVVHESFTAPPEIELGAIGRWHDLTQRNRGLTLAAQVRSVTWSSDGLTAQGWLLVPTGGAGKLPLITFVHGGPAVAATPRFDGPGLQASLLARGWAVFRPNPRGSFGQGEQFTAANVRDFGYGDLRDILTGIDAVERATPIDTARLGLYGHSYGGFMAMWAVTQTNRFRAAVAGAGISNWQSYYGENGIDQWMLPYFGASVYDDPAAYAHSSPINFIKSVRTPTFAYVGERDIECPASQTVEFWHALRALGAPTAVMIYPGEGHALRDPAHTADALRRTLEWFDRYLR